MTVTPRSPEWVWKLFQGEVLTQLQLLVKASGGSDKAQKKVEKDTKELIDEIKKGNKEEKERSKEELDAPTGLGESMKDVKNPLNNLKSTNPKHYLTMYNKT